MLTRLACQPILDLKDKVYAYEILYRDSEENAYREGTDGNMASSRVMVDSFFGFGIDKLVGNKMAFINFTEELLENDVATLFPKEKLVVEVLETVRVTDTIIDRITTLKKIGYQIALDDFMLTEEIEPLIKIADIIKLDFLETTMPMLAEYIKKTSRTGLKYLAEKIESNQSYNIAKKLGVSYFQGFYFSKPIVYSESDLKPLPINEMDLLHAVDKKNFNFNVVANIIRQDVSLTYKLLRLANSAGFGYRMRINDVLHALAALGEVEIKKWVTLVSMMGLCQNHPLELLRLSLQRAKYMEEIAYLKGMKDAAPGMFMTGLFSLLEIMLNRDYFTIFEEISVAKEVQDALLHKKGPYRKFLRLVIAHEQANWDRFYEAVEKLGLSEEKLMNSFISASDWSNKIVSIAEDEETREK